MSDLAARLTAWADLRDANRRDGTADPGTRLIREAAAALEPAAEQLTLDEEQVGPPPRAWAQGELPEDF